MVATTIVPALRVAGPPRRATLTDPKRQRLAEAIERLELVKQEVETNDKGQAKLGFLWKVEEQVEDAKKALELALADAGSELTGEARTSPLTIKEARAALVEAEDKLLVTKAAKASLSTREKTLEEALAQAKSRVRERIRDIVKDHPGTNELLTTFFNVERQLASLRRTLEFLNLYLPDSGQGWHHIRDHIDIKGAHLDEWRKALDELASNPATVLPEDHLKKSYYEGHGYTPVDKHKKNGVAAPSPKEDD
jgi:chromosome segregation ATPase